MERNADKLREVADAIEADPLHYYQERFSTGLWPATGRTLDEGYALDANPDVVVATLMPTAATEAEPCGTAFCIAGWALVKAGWTVRWSIEGTESSDYGPWWRHDWHNPDGVPDTPSFSEEGAELLGLTYEEGQHLFAGTWMPAEGMTVPDALRALADGASIDEVSLYPMYQE